MFLSLILILHSKLNSRFQLTSELHSLEVGVKLLDLIELSHEPKSLPTFSSWVSKGGHLHGERDYRVAVTLESASDPGPGHCSLATVDSFLYCATLSFRQMQL